MPSSASRTTASGSLMSFFIRPPGVAAGRPGSCGPYTCGLPLAMTAAAAAGRRSGAGGGALAGAGRGRRCGTLEARRGLRRRGQALPIPELAHGVHGLVAILDAARANRLPEAHLHPVAAREVAGRDAPRPVLAGRHRLVGAAQIDRHDVDVVVGRDHRGARARLADLAVARARALREHHEVPALVDQAVDVVRGAVAQAAALAAG